MYLEDEIFIECLIESKHNGAIGISRCVCKFFTKASSWPVPQYIYCTCTRTPYTLCIYNNEAVYNKSPK